MASYSVQLLKKGLRIQWSEDRCTDVKFLGTQSNPIKAIDQAFQFARDDNVREQLINMRILVQQSVQDLLTNMNMNRRAFENIRIFEILTMDRLFSDEPFNEFDFFNQNLIHFFFGLMPNSKVRTIVGSLFLCGNRSKVEPVICVRCHNSYIDAHVCQARCFFCGQSICICKNDEDDSSNSMSQPSTSRKSTTEKSYPVMRQIKDCDSQTEGALIIRLTWDLETVTNVLTSVLHPVCVVMTASVLISTPTGVSYVQDLGSLGQLVADEIFAAINKFAEAADLNTVEYYTPEELEERFDYVNNCPWMKGGFQHSTVEAVTQGGKSLAFFRTITVEDYDNWSVCPAEVDVSRSVVYVQNELFCLLRDGNDPNLDFKLIDDFYRSNMGKKADVKIQILSTTFNGGAFDEIMAAPYRFYGPTGDAETGTILTGELMYMNRGGKITHCNSKSTFDEVSIHPFKWTVILKLCDLAKYANALSLRQAAKAFQLTVLKGDCDFNAVNSFYHNPIEKSMNEFGIISKKYQHDWHTSQLYAFMEPDSEMFKETMRVFNSVYPLDRRGEMDYYAQEENQGTFAYTYEEAAPFYMYVPLQDYCALDVSVTNLLYDALQNSFSTIAIEMFGHSINMVVPVSTPGISERFLKYYNRQEREAKRSSALFAPQGYYNDYILEACYGGRSEIYIIGTYIAPELKHINDDMIDAIAEGTLEYDFNGVYLADINSMYACVMTADLPQGRPKRGDISKELDSIEMYLIRAKARGFRKSWDDCYDENINDFGFICALVHVTPPSDRCQLRTYAFVPHKDKTGSLVWSNEERDQLMCGVDMELLARAGWSVSIRRDYTILYWSKGERYLHSFMDYLTNLRARYTADGQKGLAMTIKLTANTVYGKTLQRSFPTKNYIREFDSIEDKYQRFSRTELQHPWKDVTDRTMNHKVLLQGEDTTLEREHNVTSTHFGMYILAYSRAIMGQFFEFASDPNECHILPEQRELWNLASETDSAHMTKKAVDRLPKELFESGVGGWCPLKKDFEFHIKMEDFQEGIPVINQPCEKILAKKLYYIMSPAEGVSAKFASKGLARESIALDLIDASLRRFNNKDLPTVMTSRNTLKKVVFGSKVSKDKVGTITSHVLKRQLTCNHNGKRINASAQSISEIDLTRDYLTLLPFDAEHPESFYQPRTFKNNRHASFLKSGEALHQKWIKFESERSKFRESRFECADKNEEGLIVHTSYFEKLVEYTPFYPAKLPEESYEAWEKRVYGRGVEPSTNEYFEDAIITANERSRRCISYGERIERQGTDDPAWWPTPSIDQYHPDSGFDELGQPPL